MSDFDFLEDSSKANDILLDSGLTVGWTLETLLRTNAEFREVLGSAKVSELSAEVISDGNGYLSTVYKATAKFTRGDKKPYTFVIKVPSLKNMTHILSSLPEDQRKGQKKNFREGTIKAHNGECEFYAKCSVLKGLPLPKVWYTQKLDPDFSRPGVILMEDLLERATVGRAVFPTNLELIKNVARHLAAFHYYQLSNSGKTIEGVEGVDMHTKEDLWSMFPVLSGGFTKYDPERLQPLIDRVAPLATRQFASHVVSKRHKQLGLPTLLCHGDMHRNNMLLQKNEDGTPSAQVAAFIDWQSAFYGNPMFDLGRFVSMCAEADIRREAEQFVVQFYYDELTSLLEESGHPLPEGMSVQKLTEAYKLVMVLQSIEAVFVVPFVEKSNRAAGLDEEQVQAQTAKLLLRTRLLLEDALEVAKDVAPEFLKENR